LNGQPVPGHDEPSSKASMVRRQRDLAATWVQPRKRAVSRCRPAGEEATVSRGAAGSRCPSTSSRHRTSRCRSTSPSQNGHHSLLDRVTGPEGVVLGGEPFHRAAEIDQKVLVILANRVRRGRWPTPAAIATDRPMPCTNCSTEGRTARRYRPTGQNPPEEPEMHPRLIPRRARADGVAQGTGFRGQIAVWWIGMSI